MNSSNDVCLELSLRGERYGALVDLLDMGFCVIELLVDEGGSAYDYRFLETNSLFSEISGLQDAVGRTALELMPDLEPWWIETYAEIVETGISRRFQHHAAPVDRTFDVSAARADAYGGQHVIVMFRDITEQQRAEKALRDSAELRSFLENVTDAMRPAAEPLVAQREACRVLADYLNVDRAFYVEIDEDHWTARVDEGHVGPNSTSLSGTHRISEFAWSIAILRRMESVVLSDTQTAPALTASYRRMAAALQIAGVMAAPLTKNGKLVGALCVTTAQPREWEKGEVSLLIETAERIWATIERARAEATEQESQQRFRTLVEGMPQLVWQAVDNGRWNWASPQWTAFTHQSEADSHGWGWLDTVHPDDRKLAKDAWKRARETGSYVAEFRLRKGSNNTYCWFQTRALPLKDAEGEIVAWLGTSTDVEDLRSMQEQLKTLVAELQHRTRNLMAVVSAVSDRSLSESRSITDFRRKFKARLMSISRATGLLSRLDDRGRVKFDELLRAVLDGQGIDERDPACRVALEGPADVSLRSSSVQTLALALNELTAQALRHGALARQDGQVTIRWHVFADPDSLDRMLMTWSERAQAPDAGEVVFGSLAEDDAMFGKELIERALPYQFSAKTSYDRTPVGVECTIDLPISQSQRSRLNADLNDF